MYFVKKDGKDIAGGRGMIGKDRKSGFCKKDRRILKNIVEKITNKKNGWDLMTEENLVEEPIG